MIGATLWVLIQVGQIVRSMLLAPNLSPSLLASNYLLIVGRYCWTGPDPYNGNPGFAAMS